MRTWHDSSIQSYRYYFVNSDKFGIAGKGLVNTLFFEKLKWTNPNKKKEKQRWKKQTIFLFLNATIVIFKSCESLILGNSEYIYIAVQILNIFCILG